MRMTFSKIIKALCREYHIDRHTLHHKLSVDEGTIDSWEKGEAFPNEKQLEDISAMFAVPIKTLKESCQKEKEA